MSDSTQHTPDRYGELMAEAALCKTSTKGMEYTFMKDIFNLKTECDALKAQRDELLAGLERIVNNPVARIGAHIRAETIALIAKHKESV